MKIETKEYYNEIVNKNLNQYSYENCLQLHIGFIRISPKKVICILQAPKMHTKTWGLQPPCLKTIRGCPLFKILFVHFQGRGLLLVHEGHLYCLICSALAGVIFTHLPWNHLSHISQQIQNSSEA